MKEQLNIQEIEVQIDIPIDVWEGNCHGIASAIVKSGMIDGRVERGHWLGDVSAGSTFYKRTIIPHSWIRASDGSIIDPTRWCFEQVEPYIYIGKDEDSYDVGGNQLRMAIMNPLPEFNPNGKRVDLKLKEPCRTFVFALLNNPPFITINQLFWLGNLSPDSFDGHVKEVYEAIEKSGNIAIIPIDNCNTILRS